MEKALKKALEGGWTGGITYLGDRTIEEKVSFFANDYEFCFEKELLNPLFWQALGKAMGWETSPSFDYGTDWATEWHSFIDHLAQGKDIDSFFNELLI